MTATASSVAGFVRSLNRALREYPVHYHQERNHQGRGTILLFPSTTKRAAPIDETRSMPTCSSTNWLRTCIFLASLIPGSTLTSWSIEEECGRPFRRSSPACRVRIGPTVRTGQNAFETNRFAVDLGDYRMCITSREVNCRDRGNHFGRPGNPRRRRDSWRHVQIDQSTASGRRERKR